jgi:hypothetical protein
MFDAYKIGVTLSLTNHVSKGLLLLASDFAKTEAQATLLQKRINSIKNDALKGGLMLGAGAGMLALLKGPYEEAKKLAQAQANFQTLNLSALENSQAFGKAATMSHQILGTTITENVKLIHDLHTAFGDLHHAVGSADMFSKMSVVAKIANGGHAADGIINAAAKALEHRGGKVINNPAEFASEANMMTQVMLGTKMRVTPADYLTASGTGKMAYQMFDKEYLYGNFAGRMAINGGARTGTESMTAFSSLIGGHMDAKGKGFLAELGLWQEGFSKKRLGIMNQALSGLSPAERGTAVQSMGGQAVISGGLRDDDAELFAHRPDLFVAKMIPLVRQRFGLDMTDEQIALMVAKNLNRSTGNDMGTQVTMALKLSKDTAVFRNTMDIGSAYQHYLKSPEGAEEAAGAAWKNFLAVFGSVYLPQITSGLLKLASGLDSLSKFVEKNNGLVTGLTYAFAALAGGLVLRGTVLLLSAAFRGLGLSLAIGAAGGMPGLVTGLGVAMAALASPIGIVIAALGLLAAAAYAFRPMTQGEVDQHRGVHLSPDALARSRAMGWAPPEITSGFGSKVSAYGNKDVTLADLKRGSMAPPVAPSSQQQPVVLHMDGRKVGEGVMVHMNKSVMRQPTGPRMVDLNMGLPAVSSPLGNY